MMIFHDRFDAARILTKRLVHYRNDPNAVILAIPRGGLQTGYGLAKELHLPLDIILTKKIGHPLSSEYAIGAVSLFGEVIDPTVLQSGEVSEEYIRNEIHRIRKTLRERHKKYAAGRKPLTLKDKTVILTDDGVATGKTLLAAIDLVRAESPKRIVVAVPVGPPGTISMLQSKADDVVCLQMEADFFAIGQFYENFLQVEDEEAIRLLRLADEEFRMVSQEESPPPAA